MQRPFLANRFVKHALTDGGLISTRRLAHLGEARGAPGSLCFRVGTGRGPGLHAVVRVPPSRARVLQHILTLQGGRVMGRASSHHWGLSAGAVVRPEPCTEEVDLQLEISEQWEGRI